ncbi:MAG: hypothetical protein IPM95_16205 [Sphingobacteriales bacterium]|nr:hypothetical protein [Sphingobacteriales bacterium]
MLIFRFLKDEIRIFSAMIKGISITIIADGIKNEEDSRLFADTLLKALPNETQYTAPKDMPNLRIRINWNSRYPQVPIPPGRSSCTIFAPAGRPYGALAGVF